MDVHDTRLFHLDVFIYHCWKCVSEAWIQNHVMDMSVHNHTYTSIVLGKLASILMDGWMDGWMDGYLDGNLDIWIKNTGFKWVVLLVYNVCMVYLDTFCFNAQMYMIWYNHRNIMCTTKCHTYNNGRWCKMIQCGNQWIDIVGNIFTGSHIWGSQIIWWFLVFVPIK